MSSKTRATDTVEVTPSARRLTSSLRDIGYDFTSALADLVDNSISAGAARIDIEVVFAGVDSYVVVADDGSGMSPSALNEALRFGTRRSYQRAELGRYGLGLKTASLSQCRRLTVVTRRSPVRRRIAARTLDIDRITATDRWEIVLPSITSACERAVEWLNGGTGTVVFWEGLDRVLPETRPESGWAERRLTQFASRTANHLGMVFHRFLDGQTDKADRLVITVNGEKVRPWNPFAPDEEHTEKLPMQVFEVTIGAGRGHAHLQPYILPPRNRFSSLDEFERLSGPLKWNRQQGLYIYRADRMIQSGGWCGMRAPDEHTKLARAALDFPTDLDEAFRINVAKMRLLVPPQVRTLLERPLNELCQRAESVYRREALHSADQSRAPRSAEIPRSGSVLRLGAALMSAALDVGEHAALGRIMDRLAETDPGAATTLGW